MGGVSYVSNRYSKANDKYLKSYEPKQKSKHIIYLDANNSYGYPMPNFLSISRFKWKTPKEFQLNNFTSNSSKGCVDLEYPRKLRELYNDYPLAPDKIEMKQEIFSKYQLKIVDPYNIPIGNVEMLVPNIFDKEKYVIHYEDL